MNWKVFGWSIVIFLVHCGFNYLWFLVGKMKAIEDVRKILEKRKS